mgnify:CR=1 FL=1
MPFNQRKNHTLLILFILIILFNASGSFAQKLSMAEAKHAGDSIIPEAILPFWQSLTLKEKVAQTLMVYMPSAKNKKKHESCCHPS